MNKFGIHEKLSTGGGGGGGLQAIYKKTNIMLSLNLLVLEPLR